MDWIKCLMNRKNGGIESASPNPSPDESQSYLSDKEDDLEARQIALDEKLHTSTLQLSSIQKSIEIQLSNLNALDSELEKKLKDRDRQYTRLLEKVQSPNQKSILEQTHVKGFDSGFTTAHIGLEQRIQEIRDYEYEQGKKDERDRLESLHESFKSQFLDSCEIPISLALIKSLLEHAHAQKLYYDKQKNVDESIRYGGQIEILKNIITRFRDRVHSPDSSLIRS